jgi:MFS family permease
LSGSLLGRFVAARALLVAARQVLGVAVSWELWQRTRSPLALGLVGLAQVVPVAALFAPAGVLVDRLDRRRLAAASAALGGIAAAGLVVASALAAHTGVFYSLLTVLGCATSVHSPAASALLPGLVPRDQLARANALASSAFQLSAIAGPALAGGILALASPAACYAVAAAGAAASASVFLSLPSRRAAAAPRQAGEWLSGLRFLVRSRRLLPALILDMFAVLFAGVTALLPIFADILGGGPVALGVMRSAPSLGAVVAALVGRRLPPWRRPGTVLLGVVIAFGMVTIAFGLSRSLGLSIFLLALGGGLDNVSVIIRLTMEQMLVPDGMRGRVGAVHYVFIGISNELGELESGVAAALMGAIGAVVAGGAAAMLVAILVAWRAPALRDLPPLPTLEPEG